VLPKTNWLLLTTIEKILIIKMLNRVLETVFYEEQLTTIGTKLEITRKKLEIGTNCRTKVDDTWKGVNLPKKWAIRINGQLARII
jgi:hypothetical protein